jgi:hypothetical protein
MSIKNYHDKIDDGSFVRIYINRYLHTKLANVSATWSLKTDKFIRQDPLTKLS